MLILPDSGRYIGIVEIANYDAAGRRVGPVLRGRNLRTISSNQVLARILAGQREYRIGGIYFEYENTAGAPAAPAFDKTTTVEDFHNLVAPKDYVRAPLTAQPVLQTGDSLATGDAVEDNRAVFFAQAIADEGENGVGFTAGDDSKIVSVGLVAMPVADDPTQDLLYARFALSTPFAKVAGQNPGVTWTTEFLTP